MADVNIMDFAAGDSAPEFYVGPENHFVCVPDIPLGIMQQVSKFRDVQKTLQETGDMEPILGLFDQLLVAESAHLFRQRVTDRTIGVVRLMKILPWIMEQFGMGHPTPPPAPSSDGLDGGVTGSTSTDGASPSESTSSESPLEKHSA